MNKKEQYEKVVEWENEEYLIIPLYTFVVWLFGYIMGIKPIMGQSIIYLLSAIAITFIAIVFNATEVTRKVYWVKKK